jgi:hypothetical protein
MNLSAVSGSAAASRRTPHMPGRMAIWAGRRGVAQAAYRLHTPAACGGQYRESRSGCGREHVSSGERPEVGSRAVRATNTYAHASDAFRWEKRGSISAECVKILCSRHCGKPSRPNIQSESVAMNLHNSQWQRGGKAAGGSWDIHATHPATRFAGPVLVHRFLFLAAKLRVTCLTRNTWRNGRHPGMRRVKHTASCPFTRKPDVAEC